VSLTRIVCCVDVRRVQDNQADINFDVLREKLGEVRQFVAEAGEGLKGLLASHMKPRNIERIDEVSALFFFFFFFIYFIVLYFNI
jgi:hypothetical protein